MNICRGLPGTDSQSKLCTSIATTLQANNGWFEIFSKSFIPDVTLLVMQDWGVHRERPRQSYNQTLLFTNAHPEMKLVHELRWGNIATFLYR